MIRWSSRLRPLVVMLVVAVVAPVTIVLSSSSAEANTRAERYEICHRTNSITNPYRRIQVPRGALNGHQGHTGEVFDADNAHWYRATRTKWGDVFSHQPLGPGTRRHVNWDGNTLGQAIFNGGVEGCAPIGTRDYIAGEVAELEERFARLEAVATAKGAYDGDDNEANEQALIDALNALLDLDGEDTLDTIGEFDTELQAFTGDGGDSLDGLAGDGGAMSTYLDDFGTGGEFDVAKAVKEVMHDLDDQEAADDEALFAMLADDGISTWQDWFETWEDDWSGEGDLLAALGDDLEDAEPTATTGAPSDVGIDGATLHGQLDLGGQMLDEQEFAELVFAFEYAESAHGLADHEHVEEVSNDTGAEGWTVEIVGGEFHVATTIEDLSPDTEYVVRFVAVLGHITLTSDGDDYSPEIRGGIETFTTLAANAIVFQAPALDDGVVGQAYGPAVLEASGGEGHAFTWGIKDGDALPDGMTLDTSSGELAGTPGTAGEFTFTVEVTDGTTTAAREVTILVRQPRTITLGAVPGELVLGSDPAATSQLTADVSPGLGDGESVTWQISGGSDHCTLDGVTVTAVSAGTCLLTATVAASGAPDFYLEASDSIGIDVVKDTQTISFPTISDRRRSSGAFIVNATASSGLDVTLASSTTDVCTVSGSTVTPHTVGTCQLVASQDGDAHYAPAAQVTRQFRFTSSGSSGSGGSGGSTSQDGQDEPVRRLLAPSPTPPAGGSSPAPSGVQQAGTAAGGTQGQQGTGGSSPIIRPRPAPPTGSGPLASGEQGSGDHAPAVRHTVDVGAGPMAGSATGQRASGGRDGALRTLRALGRERLAGFAPGTGVRVEVVGARTTGQFIVSSSDVIDPHALALTLGESSERNRADFAWLATSRVYDGAVDDHATVTLHADDTKRREVFADSGLDAPATYEQLGRSGARRWLELSAEVRGYLPGSIVHLAVTSDPIVLGEAIVDEHGNATVRGLLPVDAIEPGGHDVRVVGFRALDGVHVGSYGEVVLAPATLDEIRRFDGGTQATVTIVGQNASGGQHVALRIVPLDRVVPWWTLLVVAAAILFGVVRATVASEQPRRRAPMVLLGAAAAVPGLVLGWFAMAYALMAWAAGLGVVAVATAWLPSRRRGTPGDEDTPGPGVEGEPFAARAQPTLTR